MAVRGDWGRGELLIVDGTPIARGDGMCNLVKFSADCTVATVVYADGSTQTNVPFFKGYNFVGVRSLTGISTGTAWAVFI